MAINKVVMNTENGVETLVDLTGDSVTPQTLAVGVTAHDASGERIVGAMVVPDAIPKATKIKYIIPATLTVPDATSGVGLGKYALTFTRENVNQMFQADWICQDPTNTTDTGIWVQHHIWTMYYQGNYASQSNVRLQFQGSSTKGQGNWQDSSIANMSKTALSATFETKEFTSTDANYYKRGKNFKGLILIYDSSYDGQPIVDESKLSQFFTCDCITAGM